MKVDTWVREGDIVNFGWHPDEIKKIRELASKGFSGQNISDELNKNPAMPGVFRSRSAVCGKCYREGITLRTPKTNGGSYKTTQTTLGGSRKTYRQESMPTGKPRSFLPIQKASEGYEPNRRAENGLDLTFDEITPGDGKCRYAYGEDNDKRFCGQQSVPGTSYCGPCHIIMRAPPSGVDSAN